MPVLMRKNGFKTGITDACIDFTHKDEPYSRGSDVLTHDCQRNQLEPTEQHPHPNPTKYQKPVLLGARACAGFVAGRVRSSGKTPRLEPKHQLRVALKYASY